MLMASYIYILCQALDLRALQTKFTIELDAIATKHLFALFGPYLEPATLSALLPELLRALHRSLDSTTTMDAEARLTKVAGAAAVPLLDALAKHNRHLPAEAYVSIQTFRQQVAREGLSRLESLRRQFLNEEKGKVPASEYMGRTKAVYEFVRIELGIQMHGKENLTQFADGLNETELTIGHNITLIYEVCEFVNLTHTGLTFSSFRPCGMDSCREYVRSCWLNCKARDYLYMPTMYRIICCLMYASTSPIEYCPQKPGAQ